MNEQTLLCFDYGKKRIGVAVGQTVTRTATALETVRANSGKPDWNRIGRLIEQWQPDKLLVGRPLTLAGEKQQMTLATEKFSRRLQTRYGLVVEMIEEQLSSFAARREFKSTRHLDPVAAKLILETWLYENAK